MFVAPNDSLGKDAREQSIMNLDEFLVDNPALEGYLPVAIEGSKVDGSFYMVPESLKAVALWYDKSAIATPPTTSDELLAAVKDGSIKLGINQGVYHQFGWTGAFGGKLMDDTGKCTADQGGFADAFAYLKSLKDAGATFNTDGNALKSRVPDRRDQRDHRRSVADGRLPDRPRREPRRDHDPGRTQPLPPIPSPGPTAGTSTPTSTPPRPPSRSTPRWR